MLDISQYNLDIIQELLFQNIISDLEAQGKIKIVKNPKKPKQPSLTTQVIDYYNAKMGTRFTGDKVLKINIAKVLEEYTLDDCITVIDYILSDQWYIDNSMATLSVIFRPTKFGEKLERAILLKNKPTEYNEENNTYMGLSIL